MGERRGKGGGEGTQCSDAQDHENDDRANLDKDMAAKVRKTAAVLNFLFQDRPDVIFASHRSARFMSDPRVTDEQVARRAVKYLASHPPF